MKRRTRIQYTDNHKALMWERSRQGESLHQIARLFVRHHSSVRGVLAETGGIRPAVRRGSSRAHSLVEREDVSRALVAGHTIRLIASMLGRAPSTISREIRRNGGVYRPSSQTSGTSIRMHSNSTKPVHGRSPSSSTNPRTSTCPAA